MDQPLDDGNWPIVSASPIQYLDVSQTPAELSESQMESLLDEFGRSVELAERAGFDMIEAHCAHGYLLASFISPLTNRRDDQYGGNIDNRMLFPLAIINRMREVWPRQKPMSVRISATDWAPGGLSEADLMEACHMIKGAGIDIINVSTGQTVKYEDPVYGRMYQVPFAEAIREQAGIMTAAVGLITEAKQAEAILEAGQADAVVIGREMMRNPY